MSISKLLRYKFSYFGLALGIILGAFVTFFIPGKWESEALLLVDINKESIIRTQGFLIEADKKSCSPNLEKSLNPKNNRNMRGYKLEGGIYKLNILADSQEEASCYIQAIIATYQEFSAQEDKKELSFIKKSIIAFDDIFSYQKVGLISDDNLIVYTRLHDLRVKILAIEERAHWGMLTHTIFPVVFSRKLPTISRLIIILFSGLVGLIIGMLISNNVLKKNSKKSSDENLKS